MKAIVAIKSLKENPYFFEKANKLFTAITYVENRPTANEMANFLSNVDVAIIGAREKIDEQIFLSASNPAKIIGTLSVGLDHLDVEFLENNGVKIINSPTANVVSVAEHIMAFAFCLTKRLKQSDIAVQQNTGRSGVQNSPTELAGKTLGLIGYGKIAKTVASMAKCLGLTIIATSANRTSGHEGNVSFHSLEFVLSNSQIINISVPLNASTKNLINEKKLKLLRRNSILINTSRSEVVDHNAVFEFLRNGILDGYAEDGDNIPSYLSLRNDVICSPHLAGLTKESSDRLDNELIDGIEVYLKTK